METHIDMLVVQRFNIADPIRLIRQIRTVCLQTSGVSQIDAPLDCSCFLSLLAL